METSPGPWIDALRHSHDHLEALVEPLRLPAEAFIRLVYGRLDPAHTPPVQAGSAELDELRRLFPGL